MKIKILLITFLFLLSSLFVFADSSPWGNLKKIYFYNSIQNYEMVEQCLNQISLEGIIDLEKNEITNKLIQFGDSYFSNKQYHLSKKFYQKVLSISNEYWYLNTKVEKIHRLEKGLFFINFKNVFHQLLLIIKRFKPSFLMANIFFNTLFFSAIMLFFIFSIMVFRNYFRLAGNDFIISDSMKMSKKNMIIIIAAFCWPILIFSGWLIFPFLIFGFLWQYINENVKKTFWFLLIILGVISLLYSFNLMLERSVASESFNTVQKVYKGDTFTSNEIENFDPELKVIYAFSLYDREEFDAALDILNSTEEKYVSTLKYDLMGNIYYKFDNIEESINYYRESLRLNDRNQTTLNNFTLALIKNKNKNVFESYASRYPKIDVYKNQNIILKNVPKPKGFLWIRLLSFSNPNFDMGTFVLNYIREFLKLPIVYYFLIFLIYITLIKRSARERGKSTYCSKCSRVIKEATVHKSLQMCDECYQLFLIKDVIFLEAKILKEEELKRRFRKKYFKTLMLSIFIPGLNFSLRNNNRIFVLLSLSFYFLLSFSIVGMINFNNVYSISPILFNIVGIFAFIVYFITNMLSIKGDSYGV